MTRRKARELAMRLIYAQAATNDQPEDTPVAYLRSRIPSLGV